MRKIFLMLGFGLFAFGSLNAQNCPRYIDGDSAKTTAPYSIYREFFKKNLISEAYPYWKKIYDNAPGFRQQTYYDGISMYSDLVQKTTDESLRQKYVDTLFQVYTKAIQCYGETEYIIGKKGIDLLKYGKNSDIPEARKCLEKTLKLSGDNAYPYYIQTYFKLLVNQIGKDGITEDYVIQKHAELSKIVDKNIANPNNKQLQAYKEVKTLLDDMYNDLYKPKAGEVLSAADCAKLLDMYKKKFNENPNDLAKVKSIYNNYYAISKTCSDSLLNVELLKKLNTLEPSYSYAIRLGSIYMKNKQFDSAYTLYENAVAKETDSLRKADLYFIMASLKADKNDFPASRDLAKQAIVFNKDLGKAYLLIGTLYASSGKLCGPGTGFQSQIILWPAFDYFKKATEVGADETKEEARKMLSTYKQYLPTKAEVTAKKLAVGSTYTVKCWINEETTVQVK
jgi:tetratricopeptide (TPR) repeat protein